jgi:hypothetical protein
LGIDVREFGGRKEVLYCSSHQNLIDTSIDHKPCRQKAGQLLVSSLFRRRKSKGGDGDGNPFIYALKGLKGYCISRQELWSFRTNFLTILGSFMGEEAYDCIVPMPSSTPIARYVAKKAQCFQAEARLEFEFFRKRTFKEVLPELEAKFASGEIPGQLRHEAGRLLNALRKSPRTEFSMKYVHQRLREYVSPLSLDATAQVEGSRILIVDDLLSSGATLNCADRLLKQAGATHVAALCLLSRV